MSAAASLPMANWPAERKAAAGVFALLCIVNAVQIASASYLFSIMALPRQVETRRPSAGGAGIQDTLA